MVDNVAIFERITIIGLGLIGSSIARAIHAHGLADIVVGCDSNEVSLAYGRSHGFIDVAMRDPKMAVANSQLVILATPPSSLGAIMEEIAPALAKGAIIMDTASVKLPAMEAIAAHLPGHADFIPAHPIAGGEQSGVGAGRADLFERKFVIITPLELAKSGALQLTTALWSGMGAKVEGMPPHLHDLIYAYVSHLPQLLAFAAYGVLAGEAQNDPGLQRFLRLSRSSPALWADIFIANKENLLNALDNYLKVISHIKNELGEAPEEGEKEADESLAKKLLFPHIAASCLVTTIMEAERSQGGLSFARYAGNGLGDFTSPAAAPPEENIEKISTHHQPVARLLEDYARRLAALRALIAAGEHTRLQQGLAI